jgi:hypothetical protein
VNNPPIKCTGIQKQITDIRLFVLPELGRSMLVEGIDETIGVEHREPFRIRVTIIACFAGADE